MTGPGGITEVDVNEAATRLTADDASGRGPILLDVREPAEFAAVRAEGAALVPMSGFVERLDEIPRDRQLLVICQSGSRSAAVASYLLRSGWTDVANVAGGTAAWEKAGLPVRRGPAAAGEGDLPGR